MAAGLELFGNQAQTTVSSGGTTAPAAGTVQTWTVASSALFPAASSTASPPTFFRVADPAASGEVVLVTNVSGTTWTVTRGAEGTPVTHTAGFTVQNVITAAALENLVQLRTSVAWINMAALGADPTGATACDTIVNNAITALGTHGGVLYFPTGTYKVSTGFTASLASSQTVKFKGDGGVSTTLMYYGSGDCIRLYNPSVFGSGGAGSIFSGVHDLAIDGTNATGSAAGIHAGDITFLQIQDVHIQNFTGTSMIPVHLHNTVTWSEEGDYRIGISNCTQGVVLDVTTGFNSFGYNNFDLTFVNTLPQQTFFAVTNGALYYHGRLQMRGNGTGQTAALTGHPATISVTGVLPSTSPDYNAAQPSPSSILAVEMDVMLEPNNGNGNNMMQTVYLDPVNFGVISECYGMLDWSAGTGSFAPITPGALTGQSGFFGSFSGIINGDANLNPTTATAWRTYGSGTILSFLPGGLGTNGNFPTIQADVFWTQLAANATVSLNPAGVADPAGNQVTYAGPQRKLYFVQQPASGGPFTLTWPVNATPTTASPTVVWPGGTAPALQTAANAVDLIELITYDGKTWYGRSLTLASSFGGGTLTSYLAPAAVTLTFGTTIAVNAALGNAFNLTLTASTGTISNPTNPVDGQVIRFRIGQGTGSHTVAWGTAYDFGAGSAPTLSTAASKVDVVAFEYIASLSKWAYLGAGLGF